MWYNEGQQKAGRPREGPCDICFTLRLYCASFDLVVAKIEHQSRCCCRLCFFELLSLCCACLHCVVSFNGERSSVQSFVHQSCFRTPTVASNRALVAPPKGQPTRSLNDRSPNVGFRVMVALINSIARKAHANSQDNASLGPFQECPSGLHAKAKGSPPLHSFIREILQAWGFSEAQISSHLRKPPLRRYDSAFALP